MKIQNKIRVILISEHISGITSKCLLQICNRTELNVAMARTNFSVIENSQVHVYGTYIQTSDKVNGVQ